MNAWPLASSRPQPEWTWPITLERYDQNPALTDEERETLAAFVDRDQQGRPKRWSAQTKAKLDRLWKPLQDILEALSGKQAVPHTVSHVLIKEMYQRQVSFWGWSEQQWGETLECSVAAFVHTHGCDPYGRQDLMVIAYVLGKLTFLKGWVPQEMQRERVARKVFGNDRIDSAVERIYGIVVESRKEWGYSLTNMHRVIGMAVCWAFLVNRNPHLEAISLAFLESLRELTRDARMVAGLFHLARALAELHLIERGLAFASHTQPVWTRRETDGIAPGWIEWCHRWYQGATGLAHTTKSGYLGTLFIVGRWLASRHPEITSPHQWTSQIAAEWVQVVDTMKVGDWASKERVPAKSMGKPISPRSKVQHLAALKTFFRDLQEEPFHLPRTLMFTTL